MVIRHVKGPVVFTCTVIEFEAMLDYPMPHLYAHRDVSVWNWHTFQSLGDLGLVFHHIDRSYTQHTAVNGDRSEWHELRLPFATSSFTQYIYIYSFAEVFWSGWVGFFTEKESRVNLDDTSLEVRLQLTNSISSPVRCVTQQRKSAVRIPASIFLKFNVFFVPSVFTNFSRLQNVHTWSGAHQTSYLTLILLTWRIWWARNNASNWQMGFN